MIGVVLVKTLVTGGLLRLSGARRGTAAEAGLLMASPSETTLIVLAAATGAGLIGGPTALFWQTVTAIGLTLTPLLAKLGHAAARRIDLAGSPAVGEADELDGADRTVIIGYGRVGRMVAGLLDDHGEPYLAVEADIDAVARARARGVRSCSATCRAPASPTDCVSATRARWSSPWTSRCCPSAW